MWQRRYLGHHLPTKLCSTVSISGPCSPDPLHEHPHFSCKTSRHTVNGPLIFFLHPPQPPPHRKNCLPWHNPNTGLNPLYKSPWMVIHAQQTENPTCSWSVCPETLPRQCADTGSRCFLFILHNYFRFICVSRSIHFSTRPLFINFPSKRTMLAIDLHVKQLLRFSILGKWGHSIISFSTSRGSGFLSKQREKEICKPTFCKNTKDNLKLSSQFLGESVCALLYYF